MTNIQNRVTERSQRAQKATWIGFSANAILTILKISAGILGNSSAMLADGVHSLSDFITDIVVLLGFKLTSKPEDSDHNYGHGKYETVSTLIVGGILFYAGINIFQHASLSIYKVVILGESIAKPLPLAIAIAFASIISKESLFRYTKKVGEEIDSSALIANSWHQRSDAISSVGTFVGVGAAYILGENWVVLDPLAAVIVSGLIFKVAIEILRSALHELIDGALESDDVKYIEEKIKESEGIWDYHNLRTRRLGSKKVIEAHLVFDKNMSLQDAHAYSDSLESVLKSRFNEESIITFHMEPK